MRFSHALLAVPFLVSAPLGSPERSKSAKTVPESGSERSRRAGAKK